MSKKNIKAMVITILILVVAVLIAGGVIAYGIGELNDYKVTEQVLMDELTRNSRIVYVACEGGIKSGDIITDVEEGGNVMAQEIYSGIEPTYYISEEDMGSIALIDIQEGQPVMKNMITTLEITGDTREVEVTVVDLMVDQKANDFIDIRIMFPNGEEYAVLSKKEIKNLVLDSSIFYTYLNEEEILRLASATVDAYTMTGTKIYATRYIEPTLQNATIPNYLVRAETLDLMTSDPNIVTLAQHTMNLSARMSMEQRLSGLTEEQLAAVADGHGLQDTAKTSVLTNVLKVDITDGDESTEDGDESTEDVADVTDDSDITTEE